MATATKRVRAATGRKDPEGSVDGKLRMALDWFERHGTKKNRDGMARYGIPSDRAYGVSVGAPKALGKRLGRDHALAGRLWASGRYEARLLAAFVDDPAQVTVAQMNAWAADFDSWAVVDTVCFHVFDRTPFAWRKARQWAAARPEFVKRAGFALMASLVAHDKQAPDKSFQALLPLIERGARDERNFVKKGVNWALRTIGKRSPALNAAAVATAKRLSASGSDAARWVGRDALRELTSPALRGRLVRREAPRRPPPS